PRHYVADSGGEHDRALFRLLQAKRKELAEEAGVPPYVIFSDRSLVEMATYFPHSPEAFATIHGVGDIKVRRYADDFLPIIRDYCAANGLSEQLKRRSRPDSTRSFNSQGRPGQALDLLNGGHTILEIAHQLSVRPRTVIEYVWRAAQAGES